MSSTTGRPATLHEQIRSSIEEAILSGRLKPGDRIPSEHELMATHDCSRMTVNKALTALAQKGLIIRRKRAGTFVAPPPSASTLLDIPDIQADLQQRGKAYGYELLSQKIRAPQENTADEIDLAQGGLLADLVSLHRADGVPFALEYRLIGLKAVPEAAKADFTAASPGSWLLDHVPWSEAEHRISAISADARTADLLDLTKGAACLVLERKTWHGKRPVTHVRQIFPGDRHAFVGAFSPAP